MPRRTPGASSAPAPGATVAANASGVPTPQPQKKRRVAPFAAIGAAVVVVAIAAVAVWTLFLAPYNIDEKTFPDPGVRLAVATQLDADGDGKLTRDEAAAVTTLSLTGSAEISGLGAFFPNLASLQADGDSLATVDVSDLGALTTLSLSGNGLSDVTLSGAGSLETVSVTSDSLQNLNASATRRCPR